MNAFHANQITGRHEFTMNKVRDIVITQIQNMIRFASVCGNDMVVVDIPEYVDGFPIVNYEGLVGKICSRLRERWFIVKRISHKKLYVCWTLSKINKLKAEREQELQSSKAKKQLKKQSSSSSSIMGFLPKPPVD